MFRGFKGAIHTMCAVQNHERVNQHQINIDTTRTIMKDGAEIHINHTTLI